MPDLLDRIRAELRERLDAARAAAAEYDRLEAALRALDGPSRTGAAGAPAARRRSARRAPSRAARARRSSGSASTRAPRGANREAVLKIVADRPGVTAAELAAASGIARNTLSPLLRRLVERGELSRRELPGGQAGYSSAPAAAADEAPAAGEGEASAAGGGGEAADADRSAPEAEADPGPGADAETGDRG